MRTLLIVLTVAEIAVFLAALVVYLIRISRSLRRTSQNLAKVSFGVRAIETQTGVIGPGVTRVNEQLAAIAEALDDLAARAGGSAG
jgi:uncharacterized protein YoxC